MPIDRSKYPKDWESRSKFVRFYRAKNRCEQCGVENHTTVFRCIHEGIECYQTTDGELFNAENGKLIATGTELWDLQPLNKDHGTKIVLTTAHLNHNTSDSRLMNLMALCQRCHLKHDRKQHAETRKKRRLQGQYKLNL